ncbi:ricin-type beta-trefoil lectin domain protein [Pseudomonas sp. QL9]|uniref:ricin-type beta-trefoil lectin domain protein n=1 Tax=Pseudomonas sp. QL9 TaxID=3242725 RepID=UPI00352B7688
MQKLTRPKESSAHLADVHRLVNGKFEPFMQRLAKKTKVPRKFGPTLMSAILMACSVGAINAFASEDIDKGVAHALPASLVKPYGDTPGSYADYEFKGVAALTNLSTTFRVLDDPGRAANVFLALNYGFEGGSGSYFGFQANGSVQERTIIFSVWDTTEAEPGDLQSYCTTFTGEGRGRSCRMRYPWVENHDYKFNLAMEPDGWVSLKVTDVSEGKTLNIGRIRNGASFISPKMGNWVEYFEWSSSDSNCMNQPYSRAEFTVPFTKVSNGEVVSADVTSTHATPNNCQNDTSIEIQDGGVVLTAAKYNSARGPIVAFDNTVVQGASNGSVERVPDSIMLSTLKFSDDGLFTDQALCIDNDGTDVHGRGCSGVTQQRWMMAPMVNGGFQIRHPETGACLDHENSLPGLNRKIVPVACSQTEMDSQRWYLMPDNKLGVADECITLQSDFTLRTEKCEGGVRAQYWYVFSGISHESGWVFGKDRTIRNRFNQCLTDEDWNVFSRPCDDISNNQKWDYSPSLKTIRSTLGAGACMTANGSNGVSLEACNSSDKQKWTIPPWKVEALSK